MKRSVRAKTVVAFYNGVIYHRVDLLFFDMYDWNRYDCVEWSLKKLPGVKDLTELWLEIQQGWTFLKI